MSHELPYEYGAQLVPTQAGIEWDDKYHSKMKATFNGIDQHGCLFVWVNGKQRPEKYPQAAKHWKRAP